MKVLGISPLDKDATVALIEDGHVLFAAAEERFSRIKQHAGFPVRALEVALDATGTKLHEIDQVVYGFLDATSEAKLMQRNMKCAMLLNRKADGGPSRYYAGRTQTSREDSVPGLKSPEERVEKSLLRVLGYRLLGDTPYMQDAVTRWLGNRWLRVSISGHHRWQEELLKNLRKRGLVDRLRRFEHHLTHAANAYYNSDYDRALIVTLDGYGSGLSGSVSLGEGAKIRRLHGFKYPNSLGIFYENVTSALGFKPDRHAGKIVGLAAYGAPARLAPALLDRFELDGGDFRIRHATNYFIERDLAVSFSKIDVAAAYQHVLELVATEVVRYWIGSTGCENVVLSGGVAANVKMNQRIFEVDGVKRIFVYPNMGDGGCASGIALHVCDDPRAAGRIKHVYRGPEYTEHQIRSALDEADLQYERPNNLPEKVAALIDAGRVIARYDGRMEYGPRALGNRSILYHGRDPAVNQWLNSRLGRTEFMPFAPVTLWERRHKYYHNLEGAEHTAEFMTITFDVTDLMRLHCPAAVHVDGTARPQLIRREVNPGLHDIISTYERITKGNATLINTSFNLHEEPIVCTPQDAVRAFLVGSLDGLAIGPFLVSRPQSDPVEAAAPSHGRIQ